MHRNGHKLSLDLKNGSASPEELPSPITALPPLKWDWDAEHADRKRERKADAALHGATPFEVDRKVLKDVVREKMGREVGRIRFLSAGTFHKAYLVTLVDRYELVARVARRFMPRLKTESEVATMSYLREKTNVPVPTIYHYDSNPYNRLGGEFILMSKAPGIPLAQVFHSLPYNDLLKLLKNLAAIVIPLFAHRFSEIGSLYFGPNPRGSASSGAPTPKAAQMHYSAFPFSPTLSMSNISNALKTPKPEPIRSAVREFHVGPIISWPFFGSNRGELTHPTELNRGPWPSTESYLASCAEREIKGVISENEGRAAPHRLHLDPAEIIASRHHKLRAIPGDESDESDEWDLEESEEEWEGPGDRMYRDYRRNQRSTFLVAHMSRRVDSVRKEMGRWMHMMEHLVKAVKKDGPEEFGLDCHDLSLENVFVDDKDHTKVTCIIDWESTTTRPLWQCAHVPAFLQSSPFITKLFRQAVLDLSTDTSIRLPKSASVKETSLDALSREWLYYEAAGVRLRMAHRCAEWDGWEEGLVESILGPEEHEDEWFKTSSDHAESPKGLISSPHPESRGHVHRKGPEVLRKTKLSSKLPFVEEQTKEQMLNTTGDICGGRGGELGRRLEAWLTINGKQGDGEKWSDGEETKVESQQ
ncbi:hypothetical protein BDQ12DRAFT_678502 [Crucibulum laeve]|uniref:Aminoglycoside phosphotransferase domain-containing protein n=1 Tax=Crucibulum laeve TaxID=68775 RepID=A0A5C3MD50_9AGAR|nr:hypothetical protein BDQ12DRAFT_678502 [Crucibulum laeve]